ncbi:Transcription factor TGA1 [Camellia lanceoleosa]|uniref:Transcription factor TGA1 n=1 Tax=Camellia lanceoleosa TaxID=1840588 RepID=A0ACC0J1B8_9ERIC|nr:Transcription factor TGA1 [Camellia lanceoleosa]
MNSPTAQFVSSRRMGLYEPIHQISMWADFKVNGCPNTSPSMIVEMNTTLNNQSEDSSQGTLGPSNKFDQEETKSTEKVLRRLAQNREAARKSRLRKKAYVQQLETSRLKLIQLEQELEEARQQGLYMGGGPDTSHLGYSGTINSGIAAFKMAYERWVEVQNRQICELRTALNSQTVVDMELRILVDGGMNHYFDLFRMKATAAKAGVFYLMSACGRHLLNIFLVDWRISPFRDCKDQQRLNIYNLRQSCQQAEDALTQGMDKLQQTVSETVAAGQLGEGSYIPHVNNAMEKLKALVLFVSQADHLRQETLQQMSRILTTRQAARGLLALGEYCQRLRDLSSLWDSHHRDPA